MLTKLTINVFAMTVLAPLSGWAAIFAIINYIGYPFVFAFPRALCQAIDPNAPALASTIKLAKYGLHAGRGVFPLGAVPGRTATS